MGKHCRNVFKLKRMIMKFFSLTFLGLISTVALAEDVNKRIDAAPDGVVSVSNIAGSIEIAGWSRNEVEVTGTLGKNVEELIFERDGDEVEITVRAPRRHGHSISSELFIKIPENSSIEVVGVSSDIDIQDVFGEQRLQSVSGDIESEVHESDVEMETVSGDVTAQGDDVVGHCELSSVSGDVDAQHLAGEVAASSVSGDVTLVNSSFERVRLETVNGDIIFESELVDDGSFSLETINGDLEIEFNDSISARFDIETFNGDINNCFGPEPVRTSKYAPGTELKFTEGDGDGRVTIKTLNGDLRLCKD